jgi:starch synthase (maltosyl-transferring)
MKKSAPTSALSELEEALRKQLKKKEQQKVTYYVPSVWKDGKGKPKRSKVNPFEYFHDAVKYALAGKEHRERSSTAGEWSKDAVIYNMFVRTTTAFDHDGDGKLNLPVNENGFRETGTFLKAIALLPYIKRLGANTIHLLPVTSIGRDGNKGTLGSPYAIKNPYELDENQSEPAVGVGVNTEFKAFVEAAHNLGFRVVVEFVFRTAAKDADWVIEHPEWFYWIKECIELRSPQHQDESRYGSPLFTREELDRIHHEVREHRFDNLLPPHQVYRDFFTTPPQGKAIVKEDGRYIGALPDGTRTKIPGAFADWPPDDNQPPWGDVTYLRMYVHPDFNYIAYNTIRMYDAHLATAQNVNTPLWDKIIGIIPYYQTEYDIDGVMIDMGHALPMDLKSQMVKAARTADPDFAFWDENFSITRRSREEGYNAVFGFCWIDQHHPSRMKALVRRLSTEGFPIPFFATPENHNTPRAAARPGGILYARWSWVINSFLPAIPFIHSGFELGENYPINTGLDFTSEQLKHLPSEKLPLFSEYGYNWISEDQFPEWLSKLSAIRTRFADIVTNPEPWSFVMLQENNEHVIAFSRVDEARKRCVAVVANSDFSGQQNVTVRIESDKPEVTDLLAGGTLKVADHHITTTLGPGQCLVFEY